MSHVFISYSRNNSVYARRLAEDIRQHGYDVWIDDRLEAGDQWFDAIETAIKGCVAFAVVMSPDSRKSKWVQREILIAERAAKPIFPLLLVGEEFGNLIEIQFEDVRRETLPSNEFYRKLGRIIEPSERTGTMIGSETFATVAPLPTRRPLLIGVGVLLLVVIVAIAALLLLGGDDSDDDELVATGNSVTLTVEAEIAASETAFAGQETQTAEAVPTATEVIPSPTATTSDTPTATINGRTTLYREPDLNSANVSFLYDSVFPVIGLSSDGLFYRIDFNGEDRWLAVDAPNVNFSQSVVATYLSTATINGRTTLYREPDLNSANVSFLYDSVFPVTGISSDGLLYRIDFNGEERWLSADASNVTFSEAVAYISQESSDLPTATINGRTTLYREPDLNSTNVSFLYDSVFHVTGISSDGLFYRIDFNGEDRWLAVDAPNVELTD